MTPDDRLLVVGQLLWWAADRHAWDRAAAGFLEAANALASCEEAGSLLDLLWCYILVTRDMHEVLPVHNSILQDIVRRTSEGCSEEISKDSARMAQRKAIQEALVT